MATTTTAAATTVPITVNGEAREVPAPATVADLLARIGLDTRQVAVEPNREIVPRTAANTQGTPTSLVKDAHDAGLLVTPYTFRNENSFLPADFDSDANPADYGNALAEDRLFYELGIDGIFTDNSDTAVEARRRWIAEGRKHID